MEKQITSQLLSETTNHNGSSQYLDLVRAEQAKMIEQLDLMALEYSKKYKIYKANEVLIKSIEESLGIRSNKKNKSKSKEEKSPEKDHMIIDIDYNENGTASEKAIYALNKERKTLTTNEILEVLYKSDKTLSKQDHQKNASKFSATLSQKASGNKIFFRKENKNGGVEWGLKEWQNLNMIIKDGK
jgi:hypothetical protein